MPKANPRLGGAVLVGRRKIWCSAFFVPRFLVFFFFFLGFCKVSLTTMFMTRCRFFETLFESNAPSNHEKKGKMIMIIFMHCSRNQTTMHGMRQNYLWGGLDKLQQQQQQQQQKWGGLNPQFWESYGLCRARLLQSRGHRLHFGGFAL